MRRWRRSAGRWSDMQRPRGCGNYEAGAPAAAASLPARMSSRVSRRARWVSGITCRPATPGSASARCSVASCCCIRHALNSSPPMSASAWRHRATAPAVQSHPAASHSCAQKARLPPELSIGTPTTSRVAPSRPRLSASSSQRSKEGQSRGGCVRTTSAPASTLRSRRVASASISGLVTAHSCSDEGRSPSRRSADAMASVSCEEGRKLARAGSRRSGWLPDTQSSALATPVPSAC
mmetsp:Transcript_11546/g.29493  ORF Transcript_11546/g.29493 Transcript_11546/m.29493 type:complete len:236 (-) Transcript_11546:554-1261(-)